MNSTANATLPPRAKPAGQVDPATLAALASGLHADPFAVLGPHEGAVRTLAPGAAAVWVVAQDGQRVALQEQAHGLFTGTAPVPAPANRVPTNWRSNGRMRNRSRLTLTRLAPC